MFALGGLILSPKLYNVDITGIFALTFALLQLDWIKIIFFDS